MSDWLPLYALAGHMAADFPLQTDDMAARKFDSRLTRARHVATAIVFVLVVVAAVAVEWVEYRHATESAQRRQVVSRE